jgi:ribosomal-protein-alanine N-acetyltransferase
MMSKLEPLEARHAEALLAFERDNRTYFAASISDRGDAFFDEFVRRFRDSLAEQNEGVCAFFVLVENGEIIGRFNLYDLHGGSAKVGYRVAEPMAGHGVATAALRELCGIAANLGLRTLNAATSHDNVASQRVLIKAGFDPAGAADPSELGGRQGTRYRRDLTLN